MEAKTKLTVSGQELQQSDANALGEAGAYADDRVLWELLRLVPAATGRAIMPFGLAAGALLSGLSSAAMVQGGTNDRKVKVLPFRAIVRPTAPSGELEGLRALRSGYCVGTSTAYQTVVLGINGAGDPRWTLIYAAVSPDVASAPVSRFVKDSVTGAVSQQDISVSFTTTVVLGTVDGTAAPAPVKPTLPADAGGTFYIPIAYVWVPAGFGTVSAVASGYIHEVLPVAPLHPATGAVSCAPANQQWAPGGTVDTRQGVDVTTRRPPAYVPPTMVGAEERLIALDLVPTVGNPHASHADGDVVDDSIDWRLRLFQWTAWVGGTASGALATTTPSHVATPIGSVIPTAVGAGAAAGVGMTSGGGQSMVDDTSGVNTGSNSDNPALSITDGAGVAVFLAKTKITNLGASGAGVVIYVRATDGALVVRRNAAVTNGSIFIWLRATGQYSLFLP